MAPAREGAALFPRWRWAAARGPRWPGLLRGNAVRSGVSAIATIDRKRATGPDSHMAASTGTPHLTDIHMLALVALTGPRRRRRGATRPLARPPGGSCRSAVRLAGSGRATHARARPLKGQTRARGAGALTGPLTAHGGVSPKRIRACSYG